MNDDAVPNTPIDRPTEVWDVSHEDPLPPRDLGGFMREKFTKIKQRRLRKNHVRLLLALGLLVIIGAMAIIGTIRWAWGGEIDLQQLVVLMSPITTLAGAVFAFYFTDRRHSKKKKKKK